MNCPKCGAYLRKRSAIRRHIDHCAADLCNSFDDLSDAVQSAIIQNRFGDRELTSEDEAELRALSSVIHAVHKEIYK